LGIQVLGREGSEMSCDDAVVNGDPCTALYVPPDPDPGISPWIMLLLLSVLMAKVFL
jgi:hypothetical protein